MKQYFFKGAFIAGAALLSASTLVAQDVKEKVKDKNETQQIIITRKGDADEKTVIEIKGDKVLVNGKEVTKDNQDVNVRVQKLKDVAAYRGATIPRGGNWNFNLNNEDGGMTLFSEDANRAMLGVMTEEDEKGAKISSVTKESAAEKAGLKKGDVITKIDDQKIEDAEDVATAVHKHKPAEKTTITFLRDGKEQKVTAELGTWKGIKMNADNFRFNMPEVWNNGPGAPPRPPNVHIYGAGAPRLGMSVQDTEDGKGVKVIDVDEDSNAAKAGVKENDIITHIDNEEVNATDEISRKVRGSKDKASFQFKVLRGGKAQTIDVKVPRKIKTTDL